MKYVVGGFLNVHKQAQAHNVPLMLVGSAHIGHTATA